MTALELLEKARARAAASGQSPASQPQPAVQTPAPAPMPVQPAKPAPAPKPAPAKPKPVVAKPVPKIETDEHGYLSKCLLVTFSVSIPGNEKVDRQVTENVQKSQNMGKQSGKWEKYKFPPALYKQFLSMPANAMRAFHYANTLDWPMPGFQLLPCRNRDAYMKGLGQLKEQMEASVDRFIAKLEEIKAWAKREHNGSYDESLYTEAAIRSRCGFSVQTFPVPASDHYVDEVRSMLGSDATAVDELVGQGIKDAEESLWKRLIEPLRNIQTILTKKDSPDQTRITDSLLGNLLDIADLIPALNMNNDPALSQFAADAKAAFSGYTIEGLKKSQDTRKEAIRKADEILRKMGSSR